MGLPIGGSGDRAVPLCGAGGIVALGAASALFRRAARARHRPVPVSVSRYPCGARRRRMPAAGCRCLPLQPVRRARPAACLFAALARGDAGLSRHRRDDVGRLEPRAAVHPVAAGGDAADGARRNCHPRPGRAVADDGLCDRARQQRHHRFPTGSVRLHARPRAPPLAARLLRALSDSRPAQILSAGAAYSDRARERAGRGGGRGSIGRNAGALRRQRPCRARQGAGEHSRALLFRQLVLRPEPPLRARGGGRRGAASPGARLAAPRPLHGGRRGQGAARRRSGSTPARSAGRGRRRNAWRWARSC